MPTLVERREAKVGMPEGDKLETDIAFLMREAETPRERVAARVAIKLFGLVKIQQMQLNILARTETQDKDRLTRDLM